MEHSGRVISICIGSEAGAPMREAEEVNALAGMGLEGDRYCRGEGSFNKDNQGKRQVTLINGLFLVDSGFTATDTRRNIVTLNVELMYLIGKEFQIGDAVFYGVKYCDPCMKPSKLSGKKHSFKQAFHDRGGLIAEVRKSGIIRVGSPVIPPPKGY